MYSQANKLLLFLLSIFTATLSKTFPISDINSICGPNSVYTKCASRCQLSCANIRSPPICNDELSEEMEQNKEHFYGCLCRDGFVFANVNNYSTGCVLPEECQSCNTVQNNLDCSIGCTTIDLTTFINMKTVDRLFYGDTESIADQLNANCTPDRIRLSATNIRTSHVVFNDSTNAHMFFVRCSSNKYQHQAIDDDDQLCICDDDNKCWSGNGDTLAVVVPFCETVDNCYNYFILLNGTLIDAYGHKLPLYLGNPYPNYPNDILSGGCHIDYIKVKSIHCKSCAF